MSVSKIFLEALDRFYNDSRWPPHPIHVSRHKPGKVLRNTELKLGVVAAESGRPLLP